MSLQPVVVYRRQLAGGAITEWLFGEVQDALYTAILDLAPQRARPLGIWQNERMIYSPDAIHALWGACRA